MKSQSRLFKFICFIGLFTFPISQAVSQNFQNSYGNWSVYTGIKDGFKLCYMVSYPNRKTGNYNNRGEPYAMVTNIAGQAVEISVTSGYPYKKNTEPRLIIDGIEHRLSMTKGETAWFKTDEYDATAIEKMKKGYKLRVKGTSQIGTYSIDSYSLIGFTDAYNKMTKLCK